MRRLLVALILWGLPALAMAQSATYESPVAGAGATGFNIQNLVATPVNIKAACTSGCSLYSAYVINTTGATTFVQFFDAAAASVTPGTTVPLDQILCPTLTMCYLPITPTAAGKYTTGISAIATTAVNGSVASASGVFVYGRFK